MIFLFMKPKQCPAFAQTGKLVRWKKHFTNCREKKKSRREVKGKKGEEEELL